MVIRESVAAAVRGTRDKRFERIRLNGYENYHWKRNLLPTRPRNLPRGWICRLMFLAIYIGRLGNFGVRTKFGVVLSVPHVRSLSKISMESGKVIGSQRYSFHEGK